MEDASVWRMDCGGGDEYTLWAEYLKHAEAVGWSELVDTEDKQVGPGDCLVVVDMQNDFIPIDEVNPQGGGFAVPEGATASKLVVKLMEQIGAAGGLVACTRDYHPAGHCSWLENGGHFPKHCMQGTVGSHFYKPIGETLARLRKLGHRAEVVFKGYHEDADSFGCFAYDDETAPGRIAMRENEDNLHGCSLCDWTGCALLKCSALDEDVNAPPDVMAVYNRKTLKDLLMEGGIKRVFVCGLALDFCVLDTCITATRAGFTEVNMVFDAARSAHIPHIGKTGTGFLTPLEELKAKMQRYKVRVVPTAALVPSQQSGGLRSVVLGEAFPQGLGPFALVPVQDIVLSLSLDTLTWSAREPKADIEAIQKFSLEPKGTLSDHSPLTLPAEARAGAGIPQSATKFVWAYPVEAAKTMTDAQIGYFSLTTPSAAFLIFGGFVYLDDSGKVQAVMALALGSGLNFEAPKKLPSNLALKPERRWQPVTAPFLKAKGAKRFSWIPPGQLGPKFPCEHGAFAYSFSDDAPSEQDVYFPLASGASEHKVNHGRIGAFIPSLLTKPAQLPVVKDIIAAFPEGGRTSPGPGGKTARSPGSRSCVMQ